MKRRSRFGEIAGHDGVKYAVDETSWKESGLRLWLWALVTTYTVLFLIGPRSAEMLENALQDGFNGILISDGYVVYRAWKNRLRCWPHLIRKLRGLAESSDGRVAGVGKEMEGIMQMLMDAIYEARIEPPPEGLPVRHTADIARLRHLCARRIGWMTTRCCAASCANSSTTGT